LGTVVGTEVELRHAPVGWAVLVGGRPRRSGAAITDVQASGPGSEMKRQRQPSGSNTSCATPPWGGGLAAARGGAVLLRQKYKPAILPRRRGDHDLPTAVETEVERRHAFGGEERLRQT